MFLKRVEMQGFKSFADKVVINFEHSVTGVVGPNGCGKSNITDAIRWVLGEQSVKSLRGTTMTDVIFAGSADRKMVGMAEVTLVFDNTKRSLNSELDEIEVTRRLYRNGQDAEYLINRNNVRLKDVVDLILDSGLGKDSLSMISQGNISSFAEAKPQDRRAIFEEAAGVSKYKKRKMESLAKLERTKENIDRTQDILSELERQVSPLKRAAKKAELYKEKKTRLEEIEIAVLVEDINTINQQIEDAKKTLFNIESQTTMFQTTIQVHETQNLESKKEVNDLEKEINKLQENLMKVVNEIQILETRKIELDEKRKYVVEVGTSEEKAKQLQSLLEEARVEYEDRKSRYDQCQINIELLSEQLSQVAMQYAEFSQKNNEENGMLRRLQNRKEFLDNLLKDPFNSQGGVKSVVDNAASLHGVLGVIAQIMQPTEGYEEAISVALGGTMYNIVTSDEEAARNAINFLKKNQSGRATFLPLTVLQPRNISRENQIVCENTKGYLGVASDFVQCENRFIPVKEAFLQNVLVTDTLENGNNLASLLKYNYKIVTLDGDVIHKGGSMTGGKSKNSTSLLTVKKEVDEINQSIELQIAACELAEKNVQETQRKREELERGLMESRIGSAQLEPVVDAKRAKYEKLKNDYELIRPNGDDGLGDANFADEVVLKLNEAYSGRDEITNSIRSKREYRMKMSQDVDRKEQQIRQIRKDLETASASQNAIRIDQARLETKLENNLQRLATEYQLTYEFAKTKVNDSHIENAKEEVLQLRSEIERLGNINMNAPQEFEEVNERYEFLDKQVKDLISSRDKILSAIDEMDHVMKKQFKEMFDAINNELNDTFRALFGGGKAKLVLEDPSDILNTGVDIDVQPPGKSVQNIRLFSGGEKSLIAICVLFSILKVRPVPLCIFDEVEAALDQGNVERFARYLKNFREDTQFIVVTHRPGTMQQCEVLYGVTMQKQGVSQMLRVELKDAIDMADGQEEVKS
ncbi:chromosome segregation protein SMC [Anaerorhabdus furcosa]|uniref:Chromosome partition protein Smc n=1 Tax=Anaerorhabdus furcosa TaxID=118967 RepID=A0A1T4PI81_9FIRM|nr:chromosome segregation protein SMC [Anaerorhabdus furcosa]SJZ90548.1 chromosome segregation protein [Anaerorhabdus furcosa]